MVKAIALYTGGKDSHYALLKTLRSGINVKALIIVESRRQDSWMFHTVNIRNAVEHAKILSIPYVVIKVSGVKEAEVAELSQGITESNLLDEDTEYIISGAVASRYQKIRVDKLARELGLKHYSPLWGMPQEELLKEEVEELTFIITAIQAFGLPLKWLGTPVTKGNVNALIKDIRKYSISPVGEGGEFETYVISSPLFNGKAVVIHKASMVCLPEQFTGYYILEDVSWQ